MSAVDSKPASSGRIKTSHFYCLNRRKVFWRVAIETGRIDKKLELVHNSVSKRVSIAEPDLVLILGARNERAINQKQNTVPLQRRAEASSAQNGINGG